MLLNVFESRCGGMVDTRHLKCRGRKPVPVQVRPAVITSSKKNRGGLFPLLREVGGGDSFSPPYPWVVRDRAK